MFIWIEIVFVDRIEMTLVIKHGYDKAKVEQLCVLKICWITVCLEKMSLTAVCLKKVKIIVCL